MISEIEEALKEVRVAITLCEDSGTLNMLYKVEERLQNWLYMYVDDGK
jgi:hypothetical protein